MSGIEWSIPVDLQGILRVIASDPLIRWDGIHGAAHWGRVLENGIFLAEQTGADRTVVTLFAVLHDSRRINDGHDPQHGYRGGELAKSLRNTHVFLEDSQFELLYDACLRHTDGHTEADVTIQTCWDADRLDLGRVGIWPEPRKLCTAAAKAKLTIAWALQRSQEEYVPSFVATDWEAARFPALNNASAKRR